MLNVSKNGDIKLTRGDTARLTVAPTYDDGQPYSIEKNDTVTFTVKQNYNDKSPLIEKVVVGGNKIHIEPKDTKNLPFGKYKYDVQVTKANGDNYTIIDDKIFEVANEVG